MSAPQDLFGVPLKPDPAVALPPAPRPVPAKPGPLHRVEFVIELVGPRSVPALAASRLLDPDWQGALGNPRVHAMRASDLQWQPLTGAKDGSYDSLALSWPFLGERGSLGEPAGATLMQTAERFAQPISRRAVAIPPPADIDVQVRDLQRLREILDVGVALVYGPYSGQISERELWIACARLGLGFSPEGSFDWRSDPASPPLVSVTPIGISEAFSLAGVQQGRTFEGATIGFSVPRCPDPRAALDAAFRIADVLAARLKGVVFDDEGRPASARIRGEMAQALEQGLGLFGQANLAPGSAEARTLFP